MAVSNVEQQGSWVENLDPDVRRLYKEGKLQDVSQSFLEKSHVIFQRRLRKDAVVPQDVVSPDNPPKARYEESDYEKTEEPRYVVSENSLGSGGFGTVLDIYDLRLGLFLAMKRLKLPKNLQFVDRDQREDFIELEAKTQGNLRHKNLPVTYDFFWDNGTPVFVMEKFDPKEYFSLKESAVTTAEAITKILDQISDVVMYCHDKGLYHQDLKPTNILIDKNGLVKVLDFGVSSWVSKDSSAGTMAYLSPERNALHPKGYDNLRSEVFTLGSMLYEMVTGKPLYDFPGDDSGSMANIRLHDMPELNDEEKELFLKKAAEKGFDAAQLLAVLEKSHSKDPQERYETPEALAKAVDAARVNPTTSSS